MNDRILEKEAMDEMNKYGKYKKQTFKQLLKDAGITQSELIKYIQEQQDQQLEIKDKTSYDGSYISNMLRDGSTRKPTKKLSEYLENLLKKQGILSDRSKMSATFATEYRQALEGIQVESEKWDEWDDYEEENLIAIEEKKYIDNLLSDTMLSILYNNFDLFCQFNKILWDIIKRLEECTEEQRLKIKYEFKGTESRKLLESSRKLKDKNEKESKRKKEESEKLEKESREKKEESEELKKKSVELQDRCKKVSEEYKKKSERLNNESEKLKNESVKLKNESKELLENNKEIKDILNFSWDCDLNDRERVLNKVVELWEQWDVPLWNSLEVFGKMDEEVWNITAMIVLSDYYPNSENFSPRIRAKLDKLFNNEKESNSEIVI